jgi:hypothetical protein
VNKDRKALNEIAEIVLRYHNEFGDNKAANHCRNIALGALARPETSQKGVVKELYTQLQWANKLKMTLYKLTNAIDAHPKFLKGIDQINKSAKILLRQYYNYQNNIT